MIKPESIGRPVVTTLIYGRGFLHLLRYLFTHLRVLTIVPVRDVLQRQIFFTGMQAMGAVGLIAFIAGVVITGQIASLIGTATPEVTARVLLWTLIREIGPLLSAIVIIARSSAATASELALMRIRGELENLKRLGIEPLDYLIVPRIVGMTIATVAVTVYFQIIAVISGLTVVSFTNDVSFTISLESVLAQLTPLEVLVSLFKSFLFGVAISITSCLYGLRAEAVTDVPRAVTHAVLRNVIVLFVLDAILTYIFFL